MPFSTIQKIQQKISTTYQKIIPTYEKIMPTYEKILPAYDKALQTYRITSNNYQKRHPSTTATKPKLTLAETAGYIKCTIQKQLTYKQIQATYKNIQGKYPKIAAKYKKYHKNTKIRKKIQKHTKINKKNWQAVYFYAAIWHYTKKLLGLDTYNSSLPTAHSHSRTPRQAMARYRMFSKAYGIFSHAHGIILYVLVCFRMF